MPTGVYPRKKRGRKSTKKGIGSVLAEASSPMAALEKALAEIDERAKKARAEIHERMRLIRINNRGRTNLLKWCQRHEVTRADIEWVKQKLPKQRISRKDREAMAKEGP